VTTLIARRQQVHQHYLARHLYQYNPHLQQILMQMTSRIGHRTGAAQATEQAYARIYFLLQKQASVLAYTDAFRIMGMACIVAIVLVWFAKKNKPGQAAMGG
jgi:DHA2 family multidrug resistance protein